MSVSYVILDRNFMIGKLWETSENANLHLAKTSRNIKVSRFNILE